MKVVLQDGSKYVLRFDVGEEVVAALLKFALDYSIDAAIFSGIGACSLAEVAYYDLKNKNYGTKVFTEDLEIVSLTGNIAILKGKPACHAHAVLGRADFTTVGGHVSKIIISATCEIFLTKLEGVMQRSLRKDVNLNLLE